MREGSGGWDIGAGGAIVEYWGWINVGVVRRMLGIVVDRLVRAAGVEGVEEEVVGVSGDGGAVEVVVAKTFSK